MNNMKLIMENWRNYQLSEEQPTSAPPPMQKSDLKTFGELKKLITSVISGQKKAAIKAGAATIAVDQVLGMIPGASNAKTAFDFFRNIYSASDDKKTNTVLDKINVDDEYSKIADDKVEMAFLKAFSAAIMEKPDNEPIPEDFNVNIELQNYLKKNYKQRTLTYTSQ